MIAHLLKLESRLNKDENFNYAVSCVSKTYGNCVDTFE